MSLAAPRKDRFRRNQCAEAFSGAEVFLSAMTTSPVPCTAPPGRVGAVGSGRLAAQRRRRKTRSQVRSLPARIAAIRTTTIASGTMTSAAAIASPRAGCKAMARPSPPRTPAPAPSARQGRAGRLPGSMARPGIAVTMPLGSAAATDNTSQLFSKLPPVSLFSKLPPGSTDDNPHGVDGVTQALRDVRICIVLDEEEEYFSRLCRKHRQITLGVFCFYDRKPWVGRADRIDEFKAAAANRIIEESDKAASKLCLPHWPVRSMLFEGFNPQ